jgi:hypothetical protein
MNTKKAGGTMGKFILFMSFLILGILVTLSFLVPNTAAMWLASTASSYNLVRISLMIIVLGLLVTNPPRNTYFRYFVGLITVTLSIWAIAATYQNDMQFLDTISILATGISMGIVVLEYGPAEADNTIIEREKSTHFSLHSSRAN